MNERMASPKYLDDRSFVCWQFLFAIFTPYLQLLFSMLNKNGSDITSEPFVDNLLFTVNKTTVDIL